MRGMLLTGAAIALVMSAGIAQAQSTTPGPSFRTTPGGELVTSVLWGSERNLNIVVTNLANVTVEAEPLSAPGTLNRLYASGPDTATTGSGFAAYAPATGTIIVSPQDEGTFALSVSFFYRVNETIVVNNATAGGGITAIVRAGGTTLATATAATQVAAQQQALGAANVPALPGRRLPAIVTATGVTESVSESRATILTGRDTYITNGLVTFGPATVKIGNLGQCTIAPVLTCEGGIDLVLGSNDTLGDVTWFQDLFLTTTITRTTTSTGTVTLDIPFAAYGRAHAGVQTIGFDMASRFLTRVQRAATGDGTAPLGNGRFALFLEGTAFDGRYDAAGAVSASRGSSEGVRAGLSVAAGRGWTLGVAAEWGDWRWHLSDRILPERAGDDLWRIGGFGGYASGPWRASAAAFGGRQSVATTASSTLGGGTSTARYNASVYGAGAAVGYEIPAGSVTVTPGIGLDWLGWHSPAFAETGGLAPLSVRAATRSQFRPSLGVGLDHRGQGFAIGASARGFLVAGDRRGFVTASDGLSAGGGGFGIAGPASGRTGVDLGAHAGIGLGGRASLDVSYAARLTGAATTHSAQAGIRMTF